MIKDGSVIRVENKNYLFCGFDRNKAIFDIRTMVTKPYFSLSPYIDEIREDAINDMLFSNAVLYTVNDNLELDENSIRADEIYFNLYEEKAVKEIEAVEDYLKLWCTKVCMIDKTKKPLLPQLLSVDEALLLIVEEQTKNKSGIEYTFHNFLTDLLTMYKNTEYYDRIKEYCKPYDVSENRRCVVDLNVFRDEDKFLFIHKDLLNTFYASVKISDLHGCAIALAKNGKRFQVKDMYESVLGE